MSVPQNASSEIHKCKKFEKFPVLLERCEGEMCGVIKYNKSLKTLSVYQNTSLASSKVDTLHKCEAIKDFKSLVKLRKLGRLIVLKPKKGLKKLNIQKNDIISMITYGGEGYLNACIGNKEIIVSVVDEKDVSHVKIISNPETEGWVKLTTPRNKTGFVLEKEDFYMGYYNYEPSRLCSEDKLKNSNNVHQAHPKSADSVESSVVTDVKKTKASFSSKP